jgi:hypothetical protein
MFIVETAMTVSLLCTLPRKTSPEGWPNFVAHDGKTANCFQLATDISVERRMADEFEVLKGVTNVQIARSKDSFSIDVYLSAFDRATRRSVYAIEKDLYQRFPDLTFGVRLIDASGIDRDAITG